MTTPWFFPVPICASSCAPHTGIFLGDFAVLKFFGKFDWLEDKRRLEFDFDAVLRHRLRSLQQQSAWQQRRYHSFAKEAEPC